MSSFLAGKRAINDGGNDMAEQELRDQPSGVNRHQVTIIRQVAETQIQQALTAFAQQLPGGLPHLQGAINDAGAILDRLMAATGVFDDATTQQSPTEANPDKAAERANLTGSADSAEVHDVTSGA